VFEQRQGLSAGPLPCFTRCGFDVRHFLASTARRTNGSSDFENHRPAMLWQAFLFGVADEIWLPGAYRTSGGGD
jgi:hypothetical protein